MKFSISSLGCRLNQSEIQSVITTLRERGHELARADEADVYIINSCVVTLHSERKTRKLIYQAQRASGNRNTRIIVTGCYASEPRQEEGIYYVPNDFKYLIPDIAEETLGMQDIYTCAPSRFDFPVPVRATTTRINLKIQDGCDNFCSYCIIPYVRGAPRSKEIDTAYKEFMALLDAGFKEIVLTGVMIGKYQSGSQQLHHLVERLLTVKAGFRLHLASLSPAHVTPELIELMGHQSMVKHLNLSLQSGSNKILESMKRGYSREDYLDITSRLRRLVPDFNFTTDIIAGFPGESDDDFNQTIELIKEVGFSHIHTFRYSARPGTAAADFSDTVPEETKKLRSEKIIELFQAQKERYYSRFNERESILLSERSYSGKTRGFNEFYIPVEMDSELIRNKFYRIKTIHIKEESRMRGTIIA